MASRRLRPAGRASLLAAALVLAAACGARVHDGPLGAYVVAAAASSAEGRKFVAERAFDADTTTRWSSEFRDGEWVRATFDREVDLRRVEILWETARAADFSVSVWTEAGGWVEVARRTGAAGETDVVALDAPVRARDVMISCDRRATAWGNSILEISFSGRVEGPPPAASLVGFDVPPDAYELACREVARRLLAEAAADPPTADGLTDEAFLDLAARRAFGYFWHESNPENGLTRDRARNFESSEEITHASIAATGFALTAYAIGAARGWVPREEALARVRATLRTFLEGPVRNVHGFFPHFVNLFTGEDEPGTEISTIDTALLLAGMITAIEYFDDPEVRSMGEAIFLRVDWNWARGGHAHLVTMGRAADGKMFPYHWGQVADESLLVAILGLGSPAHPLPATSWGALNRAEGGYAHLRFMALPSVQTPLYLYPALWYDLRGRTDRHGADYFENATRLSLAMRQFSIDSAERFPGAYGPDLWGLGPADGLNDAYVIYGFPPGSPPMDGSVVVYPAAGSLPLLPRHATRALRAFYAKHRRGWGKYGFPASANAPRDFVPRDVVGLDQGTILLAIENLRTGLPQRLFMRNPWIRAATERIGWTVRPTPGDPAGPVDLARGPVWRARAGDGDGTGSAADESTWTEVLVPDLLRHAGLPESGGVARLRARFDIDADRLLAWRETKRPVVLSMGDVLGADSAWVNGVPVGGTAGAEALYGGARRYAVPIEALRLGGNVVEVRLESTDPAAGIRCTPVEVGPG